MVVGRGLPEWGEKGGKRRGYKWREGGRGCNGRGGWAGAVEPARLLFASEGKGKKEQWVGRGALSRPRPIQTSGQAAIERSPSSVTLVQVAGLGSARPEAQGWL